MVTRTSGSEGGPRKRAGREARTAPRSDPLGLVESRWEDRDVGTRHDLVAAFFDELDVLDGRITSVVPRRDRAAGVMPLLERAYAQYRPGSPGGIRADVQSNPPLVPIVRSA